MDERLLKMAARQLSRVLGEVNAELKQRGSGVLFNAARGAVLGNGKKIKCYPKRKKT